MLKQKDSCLFPVQSLMSSVGIIRFEKKQTRAKDPAMENDK